MIDKSFVGKYVCYAKQDGSFTWGRIKDQGFQNTSKGEREVFVLTDQITCRVARTQLELDTIQRLGNLLAEGKAGPFLLPGPTDLASLPSYQKFGDQKQITEGAERPKNEFLPVPVNTPEQLGLVSVLETEMGMAKSKGLPMMQKVGMVESSVDGHSIHFVLRRYGYDTSVCKASLDMETDIVDPSRSEFQGLMDGEVFLLSMQSKLAGTSIGEMFRKRKELE